MPDIKFIPESERYWGKIKGDDLRNFIIEKSRFLEKFIKHYYRDMDDDDEEGREQQAEIKDIIKRIKNNTPKEDDEYEFTEYMSAKNEAMNIYYNEIYKNLPEAQVRQLGVHSKTRSKKGGKRKTKRSRETKKSRKTK